MASLLLDLTVLEQVLAQPLLSRWIFDVELLARYLVFRRRGPFAVDDPAAEIYEEPLRSYAMLTDLS